MWSYREDDWIAEVEINENFSDRYHEAYSLKTIKTVQESSLHEPRPDGFTFTCWKERNTAPIYTPALWQLEKVQDHSPNSPSAYEDAEDRVPRILLIGVASLASLFSLSRRILASSWINTIGGRLP